MHVSIFEGSVQWRRLGLCFETSLNIFGQKKKRNLAGVRQQLLNFRKSRALQLNYLSAHQFTKWFLQSNSPAFPFRAMLLTLLKWLAQDNYVISKNMQF